MIKKIEALFERILWGSRLMIVFAVISGIISAIVMIILGTYNVISAVLETGHIFSSPEVEEVERVIVTKIISSVDQYLIATVLLIFSAGLYELFISRFEVSENKSAASRILVIHDLDQLKEKLAKVIIIVLIVTYFKYALEMSYTSALDLLYASVGILLVALSVYLIRYKPEAGDKESKQRE